MRRGPARTAARASFPATMALTVAAGTGSGPSTPFMLRSSVRMRLSKREALTQQSGHDRAREPRGLLVVERRHQDVRDHDGGHVRLDRGPERHPVHRAEAVRRQVEHRQVVVRIDRRVAVAGKMLAAGGEALALQRLDDDGAQRGHQFGVAPNARSPIAGFSALVSTSSTGAKSNVTPTDASSRAIARANRAASASSPARPSAAIGGHSVNGRRIRATRPPSWSTATQAGTDRRGARSRTPARRPARGSRRCA